MPKRHHHAPKDDRRSPKRRRHGDAAFTKIVTMLGKLTKEIKLMAGQLDALTAEVARNTEVDESAVTLIKGLAVQIESLKNDPVALQKLADDMKASSDKLAEAVAANTPSA